MTLQNKQILAKSNPQISLKRHIDDGLIILEYLKKCIPNVPNIQGESNFWNILKVCVICHDLGKSHKEFQKMLIGENNEWYYQRHELFSLPFIDNLELTSEIVEIVKYTVAGHHKAYTDLFKFMDKNYETGEIDSFEFGFDTEAKICFVEEFAQNIALEKVLLLLEEYSFSLNSKSVTSPYNFIKEYIRNPINSKHPLFSFLLLMSGAFKQCDHLSSAGINKLELLEKSDFSFLRSEKYKLYEHQIIASKSIGNVILTAPTGSGKTESAFLWIEKQLQIFGQGRVFYILPFTASINAMYERLNSDINNVVEKVGLVHGKLAEYVEGKFSEDDYSESNEKKKNDIIKAFKTLITPVKVTTPFQLLKHIFGLKGFEKGLFEWTGAYFIFDEIHAYNPSVFAQIKVLLEFSTQYFSTKIFVMTATMPSFLKEEIEDALPDRIEISANESLYDSFTRHKVSVKKGLLTDNLRLIQQDLDQGKKVLIVCNTVKNAQFVYEKLKTNNKVLIHSAFNSRDRNNKEVELQKESTCLLVGTQAIEVSLDIDYDIIYTEPAPLDALIQRFGRVNRRCKKHHSPCIVFEERNKTDKFIYQNENIILRTKESLKAIEKNNDGIVIEKELQQHIDYVYPSWEEKDKDMFNRIYFNLQHFINNDLHPFMSSKMKEEEFYEQFDGVKVLPVCLEKEYLEYLNDNQFVKAESLKVQISEKRFMQLSYNDGIQKEMSVFELIKNKKVKEYNYYTINRKYTIEKGLEIDVEFNLNTINFL